MESVDKFDLLFGLTSSKAFPMIGNAIGPGNCHDNLYISRRSHKIYAHNTKNIARIIIMVLPRNDAVDTKAFPKLNNESVMQVSFKMAYLAEEILVMHKRGTVK